MADVAGGPLAPGLVVALHAETGGNPFFLEEVTRHLVETHSRAELSRRSRRRRASTCPTACATSWTAGSAGSTRPWSRRCRWPRSSGAASTPRLLARAADRPVTEVLGALDDAARAGLVVADPDVPGRYAFAHALIRQTIETTLGAGAHRRAARGRRRRDRDRRHRPRRRRGAHPSLRPRGRAARARQDHRVLDPRRARGDRRTSRSRTRRRSSPTPGAATRATVAPDPRPAPRPAARPRGRRSSWSTSGPASRPPAKPSTTPARWVTPSVSGGRWRIFVEPMHGVDAFPHEVVALFDEARATIGDDQLALRARLLAFEAFKYGAFQLRGRDGHALAVEAVTTARELRRPGHPLRRVVGVGGHARGHGRRPGAPRDRQRARGDR